MNDVSFKIRLPAKMLRDLRTWAKAHGVSVAAAIRLAVSNLLRGK
jgi:hypothetical protein